MANITVSAKNIRPLPGAVTRRFTAGGSINVGDTAYIASDGDVERAQAGTAAGSVASFSVGLVVSAPMGGTIAAAGEPVDLVMYGPVDGASGMTPGDMLYQSSTAGKMEDAPGSVSHKFARALSATVVFVNPAMTEA
jgi:hypothetical protein